MTKAVTAHTTKIHYHAIRNTTSPDEVKTGVRSFVANLPAQEILKLNTTDNLRGYIADYAENRRNKVHRAIENTILSIPERFITRNSGFVITASEIDVDDAKKVVRLTEPSIINGAQSQGEIRRWFDREMKGELYSPEDPPFYVRAEIIVDPEPEQIVETAIARNTATPVRSISQAGARGHLDDLQRSIQADFPFVQIRRTETEDSDDVSDTRRILQHTRLLMPRDVASNDSASEKLRPYKNPEQCLTDFSEWYETKSTNADSLKRYQFMVAMAPTAIREYEYWESHDAWNGLRLWEDTKKGGRACKRDPSTKRIVWVSRGIIFPIMGAMSEFVVKEKSGWTLKKPSVFRPEDMIEEAVKQFRGHNSDPMLMGRSVAAYDALRTYPRTLMSVLRDVERSQRGRT